MTEELQESNEDSDNTLIPAPANGDAPHVGQKKKRGRPKGSKNKNGRTPLERVIDKTVVSNATTLAVVAENKKGDVVQRVPLDQNELARQLLKKDRGYEGLADRILLGLNSTEAGMKANNDLLKLYVSVLNKARPDKPLENMDSEPTEKIEQETIIRLVEIRKKFGHQPKLVEKAFREAGLSPARCEQLMETIDVTRTTD